MDFLGYFIGGLFVGEIKVEMYEMIRYLNLILLFNKLCYLMGVGVFEDLLENVINGVDMFDCVLFIRNVRYGIVFIIIGKVIIKNK